MSQYSFKPLARGNVVFQVAITCDVCSFRKVYAASSDAGLDQMINAEGWTRFAPSGSDLCWKCKGSSPNTIVQVRK